MRLIELKENTPIGWPTYLSKKNRMEVTLTASTPIRTHTSPLPTAIIMVYTKKDEEAASSQMALPQI